MIESLKRNDVIVNVTIKPLDNYSNNTIDISDFNKVLSEELIDTIKLGINNSLNTGPLIGYPLTGVNVKINKNSLIPNDCDTQTLLVVTQNAIKETLKKSECHILEPLMKLNIEINDKFLGNVISDITSRRNGYVEGIDVINNNPNLPPKSLVKSIVPLQGLIGYSEVLRGITEGEGRYEMIYHDYSQLSKQKEEKMLSNII